MNSTVWESVERGGSRLGCRVSGRQRALHFQHHDESRIRFEIDRSGSAPCCAGCRRNGARVIRGGSDESIDTLPISNAFVRRHRQPGQHKRYRAAPVPGPSRQHPGPAGLQNRSSSGAFEAPLLTERALKSRTDAAQGSSFVAMSMTPPYNLDWYAVLRRVT